ncbi:uncharacterized protein LOC134835326 [Culicoides brevitarsis]|uniref:uncharacterized protein LOC134835326 n=1 Tax=Culicoides brevitarsis TaxID=469753 RepID=UPI00307C7CE4
MKVYSTFKEEKLFSIKNDTEAFFNHINSDFIKQFLNNERLAQPIKGLVIGLYSILIALGSLGNLFILFIIIKKPSMRNARNVFIFNLATSDLLLCLITMPLTLLEILTKYWPFGSHNFVCKLLGFLQTISIYVSTLSITAISMDRYQIIIHPMRNGLQMNDSTKIIIIIWVLSGLFSLPIYVNRKLINYNINPIYKILKVNKICYCIEEWPFNYGRAYYSIFSLFWQYLLQVLIILLAYLKIYCNLKNRSKNQKYLRRNRYKRTNTLLLLIALVFGISWLPLNFYNLYMDIFNLEDTFTEGHVICYAICHMLAMSSACLNPVIYGLLNDNFRKELKNFTAFLIIWKNCNTKQKCPITINVKCSFDNNKRIDDYSLYNDNIYRIKVNKNEPNKIISKDNNGTFEEDNFTISTILTKLIDKSMNISYYEIIPGIFVLKNNVTTESHYGRSIDEKLNIFDRFIKFAESHVIRVPLSLTENTGRLFFFKGMKKLMWPLLVGIQMVKLTLFAIFLPSIIGSVGKIVSKGLTQVSGFSNHAPQHIDDLEFRDNYENMEAVKDNDYIYSGSDTEPASANSFISQMYQPLDKINQLNVNKNKFSTHSNNFQMKKNPSEGTNKNVNYQVFQDIPNSSLLLTNYDPFYSPLLSRLDAVFQQLKLPTDNESCRQKLICLMYTNPSKYAPYSNLVSAQLSRELNELKKPTSDNPDILRFFKYMKAAKDGQDKSDCEMLHRCSSVQSSSNPTMINTFNDINKLVEARNIS